MGKLKSAVRQKIIDVVKYAVREEIGSQINSLTLSSNPEINNSEVKEEIVQRLDKQIERWTWDRYKKTNKLLDDYNYEIEYDLNSKIAHLDKKMSISFDKYSNSHLDTEDINSCVQKSLNDITKNTNKQIEKWTWERYNRTDKSIENWTWDRYNRTLKQFESISNQIAYQSNKIKYNPGEKIRIAILYQIPSCWPSIESVYQLLKNDDRFETTLLLYDRELGEPVQMAGARDLLIKKGIQFKEAEYYNFRVERPHIMLYQTPWDENHRPAFLRSDEISALGIRVAYIPYGVHYMASGFPDFIFSDKKFMSKPWFMSCLSEELRLDHMNMSLYGGHHVFVTGHPKFDAIYHKEDYVLPETLKERIGTRKIVFMQMHFAEKEGNPYVPEPDIDVYLEFLKKQSTNKNYFFFVRPHPKFFEMYIKFGRIEEAEELQRIIQESENLYLYDDSDYRPALFNADCVIGDRSALMVEAGALDIPVIYMTNFYFQEQLLPSIKPLFDSYYQGNTCYDMEFFLDYVIDKGHDYKKTDRQQAKKKCIPHIDGKCSQRIIDSMVALITSEG